MPLNKMKNLFFCRNKKGMALIMVLSTIVFIIVLLQETVFETQIEYRSAISELNSLRAYYAAKSGMEINLLRLKAYQSLIDQYGEQLSTVQSYVDLVWKFPFEWPPILPEESNSTDIEKVQSIKDRSFMKSEFSTNIEPVAGRIDINDLASPAPSLRTWTFQTLYRLIILLRANNKKLEEDLSEQDIVDILHNIKDWVDPDSQRAEQVGVFENSMYETNNLPPNRSFISPEELLQVKDMTASLYDALKPFITVYGEKGLNINAAPVELLQALHDEFPLELAQEIVELTHNSIEPTIFTKELFEGFLEERGFSNIKESLFSSPMNEGESKQIPSIIYFDAPRNFYMESTGRYGKSQKSIRAIYFDVNFSMARFNQIIREDIKNKEVSIREELTGQSSPATTNTNERGEADRPSAPFQKKLKPIIIYWKENF